MNRAFTTWPIIVRDVRKDRLRDALMRLNIQLEELEAIMERRRSTEEKLSALQQNIRTIGAER